MQHCLLAVYSCPSVALALKHGYSSRKAFARHTRARWALFKGQTFAAHGRGGLVSYSQLFVFFKVLMIAIAICCAKSNQRRAHVIIRQLADLPHRPLRTIRQNHGLQHSFPTDRSLRAHASESAAMPLPSHRPPSFCLILAEAVLVTARAQRFFICLLKNLSLRGASQGLRVGSDVAIARYAFSFVLKLVPA